jgi:hypothetical protein
MGELGSVPAVEVVSAEVPVIEVVLEHKAIGSQAHNPGVSSWLGSAWGRGQPRRQPLFGLVRTTTREVSRARTWCRPGPTETLQRGTQIAADPDATTAHSIGEDARGSEMRRAGQAVRGEDLMHGGCDEPRRRLWSVTAASSGRLVERRASPNSTSRSRRRPSGCSSDR